MNTDDSQGRHQAEDNARGERLNRLLARHGLASRRGADRLIEAGRVRVNGVRARPGLRIMPGDVILVDDKPLNPAPKTLTIKYYKPRGVTCTTARDDPNNIISRINHPERLVPVGRLDRFSSGLILLTNDGTLVHRLLRPEFAHEREYEVRVDKPFDNRFIRRMQEGVQLEERMTRPCRLLRTGPRTFRLILTEGLNRQIRRMCATLGYHVQAIRRTRIGPITLGALKADTWTELSEPEARALKDATGHAPRPPL